MHDTYVNIFLPMNYQLTVTRLSAERSTIRRPGHARRSAPSRPFRLTVRATIVAGARKDGA